MSRTLPFFLLIMAVLGSAGPLRGQDVSHLYNQAEAAIQQGQLDRAAAIYQEAARLLPQDAEPYIGLGYVYIHAGRMDQAFQALHRAVTLEPSSSKAHLNLGFAYWTTGDRSRAMVEYGIAIRMDPSNAMAQYNLGNSHQVMGSPSEAIPYLQEAIRLQPDFVDALVTLGSAHISQGDPGAAVEPLRRATQIAPSRGDAHYNLGLALGRSGDIQGASVEHQILQGMDLGLATRLVGELGERIVQAHRLPTPEIEREEFVEPQPEDPSVTLLGVRAEEDADFWDQPGARDAIVGTWGGAFDHSSMPFPLGEGTLSITKTDEGVYSVVVSSGWVKIDYKEDSPYFQGCTLRFEERRGSGFNSIFTYRGDSGFRNQSGDPIWIVLHLQPHPYGNIRLVPHIGWASSTDLSGLTRVQGG